MGYQQQGPPSGYQPVPQPQQQPAPFDFNGLMKRFSTGDLVIGGALILLFIFSFIGGWFHISEDGRGITGAGQSVTYGSLWGGLGIVAALLILVAMAFFVIRQIPQVALPALPLPDWQIWMGFGVLEAVLIALNWLVGKGSYLGFDIGDTVSKSPGWAFYVGLILSIAIAVGGYLKMQDPALAAAPPRGGGYGGQPGYGQPPTAYGAPQAPPYAAPPQAPPYAAPGTPATPPYAPPPQQGYPPQQPGYGAPQQPGYPPQQPPPGYPPQS